MAVITKKSPAAKKVQGKVNLGAKKAPAVKKVVAAKVRGCMGVVSGTSSPSNQCLPSNRCLMPSSCSSFCPIHDTLAETCRNQEQGHWCRGLQI